MLRLGMCQNTGPRYGERCVPPSGGPSHSQPSSIEFQNFGIDVQFVHRAYNVRFYALRIFKVFFSQFHIMLKCPIVS